LAGAARIVLTAAFARELGANKFGNALAAALAATPAVWYVNDHQFAMNAFEPLFWTGSVFCRRAHDPFEQSQRVDGIRHDRWAGSGK